MRIVVRGIPAPQGSKRPVRLGNGRTGLVESSRAVGPWREAVRAETQRAMNGYGPADGPLQVSARFYFARPKSHWRTGRNAHLLKDGAPPWPWTKPDVDKLARAILDGLTEGGAWIDDGQVVKLAASKHYATPDCPAGCIIEFYQMGTS